MQRSESANPLAGQPAPTSDYSTPTGDGSALVPPSNHQLSEAMDALIAMSVTPIVERFLQASLDCSLDQACMNLTAPVSCSSKIAGACLYVRQCYYLPSSMLMHMNTMTFSPISESS